MGKYYKKISYFKYLHEYSVTILANSPLFISRLVFMFSDDANWLLNSSVEDINKDSISLSSSSLNKVSILSDSSFVANKSLPRPAYYIRRSEFSSFSVSTIFGSPASLMPGSIVVVGLGFFLEHTGVYIGNNQVVELYGDGSINLISLREFLMGGYKSDISPRTGLGVFTACYKGKVIASEKVAFRAKELIGKRIEYHILKNNCHMFAGYCFSGKDFQKNTDCTFFRGLTKKIIDSTLVRKLEGKSVLDIFRFMGGLDESCSSNGGFSESDLNEFSWKFVEVSI